MKIRDILSNLCYYDKRNPLYDEDYSTRTDKCMCDNCFYGRTGMAEELLRLTPPSFHNPDRENNKREQEAYGNLLAHTNDAEEVLEQIMAGQIPHIIFSRVK